MAVTRSKLKAWIDAYATPDAPDAQALADFLGIELAPESAIPVGQRRRSPEGVEVIKTDERMAYSWRKYRGRPGPAWFTDAEVAYWGVITDDPEVPEDVLDAAARWIAEEVCSWDEECDSGCLRTGDRLARILADAGLLVGAMPEAPKCNREHLPEGHVRIDMRGYSSASVREIAAGGAYMHGAPLAAAARAELARRGES